MCYNPGMKLTMIQAQGLTKQYQKKAVVSDVDLAVKKGEIFGLLGPNAAGKTTTIRMLCGIISPDRGKILINGMPIKKAKRAFGYVAQHFGQYEELTVWENLRFYAQMYDVRDKVRLNSLLERYHLSAFKHKAAGLLSGGYKRRLALVCALAHDPDVLFLDEPTAGIDPVTRKMLWDDFYALSAEGKTLFVTTHYMEEAQRCHQLAFLAEGKMIAQGTPESIKSALGNVHVFSIRQNYAPQITRAIQAVEGVILTNQFGDRLHIVADEAVTKSSLEAVLHEVAGTTMNLEVTEPDLEDVFIALTQGEHR